jgi:hypothetical protein
MATNICKSTDTHNQDPSSYRLHKCHYPIIFSLVDAKSVQRKPIHADMRQCFSCLCLQACLDTNWSLSTTLLPLRQGPARNLHPHRLPFPSWWTTYRLEVVNSEGQTGKSVKHEHCILDTFGSVSECLDNSGKRVNRTSFMFPFQCQKSGPTNGTRTTRLLVCRISGQSEHRLSRGLRKKMV